MSFVFYDLSFLVIFSLAIGIFLFVERKKLVRDGIMFLYKTSIGLKFMDNIAKKYPKTLKILSYIIVATGIILLLTSIYFLVDLIRMFMQPEFVKLVKIPPITPLIPYLPSLFKVSWLPPFYFTYWIIAIALVAIFHEGFHGIFARFNNIRIKSSGFGFLGPFLAFFVEQDEKQMKKAKPFSQMTVLAAGVFSNILLTIIFLVLMIGFFNIAYQPSGAIFNDYVYALAPSGVIANSVFTNQTISLDSLNFTKIKIENQSFFITNEFFKLNESQVKENIQIKIYYDLPAINSQLKGAIIKINDVPIRRGSDISKELGKYNAGENIRITTRNKNSSGIFDLVYDVKLGSDPYNSTRPVIGISMFKSEQSTLIKKMMYKLASFSKDPNVYYEPKFDGDLVIFIYNLLFWLFMINFGVALANMWPVAIFDGGYFFYLLVFVITKNKKIAEKALKISTGLFLAVIVLLMILWAKGMF